MCNMPFKTVLLFIASSDAIFNRKFEIESLQF